MTSMTAETHTDPPPARLTSLDALRGVIWQQNLTLLLFWPVRWWMYRRKIFLKI